MIWAISEKANFVVERSMVEEILSSGQMSRYQHFQLSSALLANPTISDEERCQISRVFDYIQTGRIQLVD